MHFKQKVRSWKDMFDLLFLLMSGLHWCHFFLQEIISAAALTVRCIKFDKYCCIYFNARFISFYVKSVIIHHFWSHLLFGDRWNTILTTYSLVNIIINPFFFPLQFATGIKLGEGIIKAIYISSEIFNLSIVFSY